MIDRKDAFDPFVERTTYNIVITGDAGAGKSCIMLKYMKDEFEERTANTIGIDVMKKPYLIEGEEINLQIWDTAGQDRFRAITTSYYKKADGIMLAYDVTNRESFDSLTGWLQDIEKLARADVDLLFVGNKSDLLDLRQVSCEEGLSIAKKYGTDMIETSAKSSSNIKLAFDILVRAIHSKRVKLALSRERSTRLTVESDHSKSEAKKTTCCDPQGTTSK
eukprot:TRINITY_DN12295_c0_g2_i2.p1 TRINITY_DN12295_c0_g2~~TRINITY_DN12295_c0_g2_i2.p1  ORF type:complete len:220 (-),score=35.12 TRINITY_DN12295_c0_g2_i2:124-783(-)